MTATPSYRTGLLLAAGLALAWGLFWPVMKVAIGEFPVFTFRLLNAWLGAAGLFALALALRQSCRVPRAQWGALCWASLFNVTLWFALSAVGLLALPAGRAVLLAYSMPLWAYLLAWLWLGQRPGRARAIGLALGLAGIAVLGGRELLAAGQAPLGAAALILGAVTNAIGTLIQKRVRWQTATLPLAGWQLMIGGVPLLPLALLDVGNVQGITPLAAFGLAYIVAVSIVFGYWAWFRMVHLLPVTVSSLAILAVPPVGIASSALVLGERFGAAEIVAAVLIMAALVTTLPRFEASPVSPSQSR